ncbi:uncharacterized protein LOC116945040 isoform X1 [Petromyzon marinus]|uniref:uncharacterized protein LOC116945040 isoform X1 n=2 Tax=Petromyzon marinus TaxID=7757 RepID=UPI003F6F2B85
MDRGVTESNAPVTCQQGLSTTNVDAKVNTTASLPCGQGRSAEPGWVVWFRVARGARGQPVPVALCSEKEAFIPSCDRDGGGASGVGRLCCSGSGVLTIRRVEAGDTGTYTCVTGALLGQHVCNNSLTVCEADLWKKSQISKRYNTMTMQLSVTHSLKTYLIHVYTGIEDKAGTDEAVSITIHGSAANPATDLTSSKTHNNPFEHNQKDTFILKSRDIGNITRINVSHGGAWYKPLSGWNLDKIEVEDEESHTTFMFPLNDWIDGGSRVLHVQKIIMNSQFQNHAKEEHCIRGIVDMKTLCEQRFAFRRVTAKPFTSSTEPRDDPLNSALPDNHRAGAIHDRQNVTVPAIAGTLIILAPVALAVACLLCHLRKRKTLTSIKESSPSEIIRSENVCYIGGHANPASQYKESSPDILCIYENI